MDISGKISQNEELKGLVANIQDYTVHDGSGLRSLVFLKGCMLRCRWCQNPESINAYPEIAFHSRLCVGCGRCEEVCPEDAIVSAEEGRVDRRRCTTCMECAHTCPVSALTQVGTWMTVEQVLRKVRRYIPFYIYSEGGVTISGGDPLFQAEFTAQLAASCRKEGIHTAIETCGHADYEALRKVAQNLDLLLYDLKHMNDTVHAQETGVGNQLILANLARICEEMPTLHKVIRIPLIPGYNDDEINIRKTVEFVRSLDIRQIDLLPFNDLPGAKYTMMGSESWIYDGVRRQDNKKLNKLRRIVEKSGLRVTVGGLW